jgi:hypothetical protein
MSLCDYLDNSDGWTKRSKWFKILNLINVMIERVRLVCTHRSIGPSWAKISHHEQVFDSRWIKHIYKFFQTFTTLYFTSTHKNIIFYCFSFLSSFLLQEVIIIYQHQFLQFHPLDSNNTRTSLIFSRKIIINIELIQPPFTTYPSCNFCSLIVKLKH